MTCISLSRNVEATESQQWTLVDSFWSLVVALAVAAATLGALGLALHVLNTNFSFSLVHAVHQFWAWISILVMSFLWLGVGLVHQIRSGGGGSAGREPAQPAGEAESGAGGALLAVNRGRNPPRRPGAYREVGA